jgi:predicted ATPase
MSDHFDDLVRDALKNLHDVAYLQTHSLTKLMPSEQHVASIQVGRLLAQHLRDAIAALHNADAPPARGEAERRYRLLFLRYVDGLSPEEVQKELSISRSTYQREQVAALAAVSSLLREKWNVTDDDLSGDSETAARRTSGAPAGTDESPQLGDVPVPLTSFFGRDQEVAHVIRSLDSGRLVTLTGPPGIGKTRLALEIAAKLKGKYRDGVNFVSLAAIRDPALVVSTIARIRRVRELPGRVLLEALADDLRDRHLLIVLDNFEQVLASAPVVANLLASAPRLHALVTSRAPLHVRGEGIIQISTLAMPMQGGVETADAAGAWEYAAVGLFVERAQASDASFALTNENAADVIEICRRVDGLPLAIELAAARCRILSPRAIRLRLESRLSLLTSGHRDLPERQQGLRAAIDWSYDLLDEEAKRLFRDLAVFAGGCDLVAIAAVCGGQDRPGEDLLGQITSLVDHSLVLRHGQPSDEPRFRMLESIREYAMERLVGSGDDERLWRRYAAYYRELGEEATARLMAPSRTDVLVRLDVEHDNLRAVLRHLIDRGEASATLELVSALAWYWLNRNFWSEGRRWLQRALDLPGVAAESPARASALLSAGILAVAQGDFSAARELLRECVVIYRAQRDKRNLAIGLGALANVSVRYRERSARALVLESLSLFRELEERPQAASMLLQLGTVLLYERDIDASESALSEGLAIWRNLGDPSGIAEALRRLGQLALARGDTAPARVQFGESLAIYRQLSGREGIAKQGIAVVLALFGDLERREGNADQSSTLLEESFHLARELGDADTMAAALLNLGRVKRDRGDIAGALACFRDSLLHRQRQEHVWGILAALREIAGCATTLGDAHRTVRIHALVDRLESEGNVLTTAEASAGGAPDESDRQLVTARAILGDDAFAEQWEIGRAQTLDQAVGNALELVAADVS